MFAKRSKQSTGRQPPSDDGSQTGQSGSHSRGRTAERLEDELEDQRAEAQRLREALDAEAFKSETLEKSYAKQLAELRDKLASTQSELKEKEEILEGLGGGHEHTLRELNDAIAVIKVLKAERDKLRQQVAQGGFRQSDNRPKTRARMLAGDTMLAADSSDGTSDGTINALIANAGWVEKKPGVGGGQATAQIEAEQEPAHEEMLSPELVFTAKDKEKEDER